MKRTKAVMVGTLVLSLSIADGCGGATQPQPTVTSVSVAASAPAAQTAPATTTMDVRRTTHSLQLGHYSTANGATGFVLDRTSRPWRIRIDGQTQVMPLVQSNQDSDHVDYSATGGDAWLRIYGDGYDAGRVLFDGPDEGEGVEAYRDGDADPLPR